MNTSDKASDHEENLIREKEAERIAKHIPDGAHVIATAIGGKEYSSVEFSEKIEKLGVDGVSHIVFLIGGSIGLDMGLLQDADERISFSRMTFPHQLIRVFLLEQLFRAFKISNNETYHW